MRSPDSWAHPPMPRALLDCCSPGLVPELQQHRHHHCRKESVQRDPDGRESRGKLATSGNLRCSDTTAINSSREPMCPPIPHLQPMQDIDSSAAYDLTGDNANNSA